MRALPLLVAALLALAAAQSSVDYDRLLFAGYDPTSGLLYSRADGSASASRRPADYAYDLAPNAAWVDAYGASNTSLFVVTTRATPVTAHVFDAASGSGSPVRSGVLTGSVAVAPDALLCLPERDLLLAAYSDAFRVDAYSLGSLAYFGQWTGVQRNSLFRSPRAMLRLMPENTVLIAFAGSDSVFEFDSFGSVVGGDQAEPWASVAGPAALVAEQTADGNCSAVYVLARTADGAGAEVHRYVRGGPSGRWASSGSAESEAIDASLPLSAGLAYGDATTLLAAQYDASEPASFGQLAAVCVLDGEPVDDRAAVATLRPAASALLLSARSLLPDREATDAMDQYAVDAYSIAALADDGVSAASRAPLGACEAGASGATPGRLSALYRCGSSLVAVEDLAAYQLELLADGSACFVRYLFVGDNVSAGAIVGSAFDARSASLYLAQDVGDPNGHSLVSLALALSDGSLDGGCSNPNASLASDDYVAPRRAQVAAAIAPRRPSVRMFVGPASDRSGARLPCHAAGSAEAGGLERLVVSCLRADSGVPDWSQALVAQAVADAWVLWQSEPAPLGELLVSTRASRVTSMLASNDSSVGPFAFSAALPTPPALGACRLRAANDPDTRASLWSWCSQPDALYWWSAEAPLPERACAPANGSNDTAAPCATAPPALDGGWALAARGSWARGLSSVSIAVVGRGAAPSTLPPTVDPRCASWSCQTTSYKVVTCLLFSLCVLGVLCFLIACIVGIARRRRHARAKRLAAPENGAAPAGAAPADSSYDSESDDDDQEAVDLDEEPWPRRARVALCGFFSCAWARGACQPGTTPTGKPRRRGPLGRFFCWACDSRAPFGADSSGVKTYVELNELNAGHPNGRFGIDDADTQADRRAAERQVAEAEQKQAEEKKEKQRLDAELERVSLSETEKPPAVAARRPPSPPSAASQAAATLGRSASPPFSAARSSAEHRT